MNTIFLISFFLLIPNTISLLSSNMKFAKHEYKIFQSVVSQKTIKVEKNHSNIFNNRTRNVEALITSEIKEIIEKLSVKFDMKLVDKFIEAVDYINKRYEKKFIKYNVNSSSYQFSTIEIFVNETLMEKSILKGFLNQINNIIVPIYYGKGEQKLFDKLVDYFKIETLNYRDCDERLSYHQQLFVVYNLAIISVIRGYTMISYSYKIRQREVKNKHAWEAELRDTVQELREMILSISKTASIAMKQTSNTIRRCDPKHHIEDVTFIHLKHFLSVFLTTQMEMSNDFDCYKSCSSHKEITNHNILRTYNSKTYPQLSCLGTAYNCWKTSVVLMCPGTEKSGRRFEALKEWTDFQHFTKGNWSDECRGNKIPTSQINSDPLCDICACTCDDRHHYDTIRTFSLRTQYTNINDNRVITGIKFNVRHGVIFIDIQDGQMINGSIVENTVRWNSNASYPPEEGPQTVKLNFNWRTLELDDIILNATSAVTGIKFHVKNNRLSLMIAGVPIYDESGAFIHKWNAMKWFSPEAKLDRTELMLSSSDIPTREQFDNVELSKPGKHFIKFQLSDWLKDASQTTVPFLDLQEIITLPPSPISGIGIFFKGQSGSGGFIALKIIVANCTVHLSNNNLNRIFPQINNMKK